MLAGQCPRQLDRLERALVRRGLQICRYNDDFRFTCRDWSAVVRSIEVLSDEARRMGLTINDMKTITWRRSRYVDHLNESERLRQEIADEAELDLTFFVEGAYDNFDDFAGFGEFEAMHDFGVVHEPDPDEVSRLTAIRVLETRVRVAGRSTVAAARKARHRAVVELLPLALATLGTEVGTTPEIIVICGKLLRFERTMTPAVGRYLSGRRSAEEVVLRSFDRLLGARS